MNNVHKFSNRGTIEAEARAWLIRLDGDTPLREEEISALREWAGRSPAHRQELKRISRFWNIANILTELAIPLHGNTVPKRFADIRVNIFSRYRLAAVTAVFLLTIGISLISWMTLPEPDATASMAPQ